MEEDLKNLKELLFANINGCVSVCYRIGALAYQLSIQEPKDLEKLTADLLAVRDALSEFESIAAGHEKNLIGHVN